MKNTHPLIHSRPASRFGNTLKLAAVLTLGLLLPPSADAGPKFWTGGYTGANGSTWSNAANWSDGAGYANGSDVYFAGSNINNKPSTWLGANRTINSLTFSNNCVAAFGVNVSAAQTGGTAATLTFLAGNGGITIQSGDANAHFIGITANPTTSAIILQDNLTVTNNGSGVFTILTPITTPSGNFGLTVNGSGVVLLSGPNTYGGDTIITAGTLRLGTGTNLPDGPAKGNLFVNAAGTLDMNGQGETINGLAGTGLVDNLAGSIAVLTVGGNDQNSTFDGTIRSSVGEVDLVKTGLGTLTLSGVNSYSGPTTIGAGKLVGVVGGAATSSTVTITNAAAKLGVSITDNTKSWTCAALTAAAAGGLEFNFGTTAPSTTVSPLIVSGSANFSVATPVVTVLGNNLSATTYPLMTWGSLSGAAPTAVTLPAGVTGHLSLAGNTLNLVITSVSTVLTKANDQDNLNLGTSWVTGVVPGAGTVAPWDSTVTGPNTTILGANLAWAGIKISNPAGLVTINDDRNTLTLGGAATAIDLSSATAGLTLNCLLAVGGASNVWSVAPGQTLTLGNVVSGASPITKQGGGTATLAGTNTFSGGLSLTAGTLNINSPAALGATASTFTFAGGALDNTSGGPIVLANSNPQFWNADLAFIGTTNLALGGGAVTLGTNRTVTVNLNTLTVDGAIGDGGQAFSLTKLGNGTLVLNGANTFNGGVNVNAGTLTLGGANTFSAGVNLNVGTLNLNHPAALGTARLNFIIAGGILGNTSGDLVTLNNNPEAWTADFTFNGPYDLNLGTGAITNSASRIVTVNGTNTLTVGGVISSSTSLQLSGTGIMALTGLNTYTGQTIIQGGTLQANTIANAGVPSSLGAATAANSVIQIGNISGSIGLRYTGNSPASTDRQIRIGNNGNGGNSPFIQNNNADPANTLTFSNPKFNTPATGAITTGARTLTLNGSNTGNNTILGTITNNAATAGGANNIVNLTKAGTGTWVLGGTNYYTGPTTINAGTLVVNGSILASSSVAVNNNGTLGGTGIINSPASVNAGATLAPGASAGTLSFGNNLTFDAAANAVFDCTSSPVSGNDQVVLTNASAVLTGGGATITLNQLAGTNTLAATDYLLFNLAGASAVVASDFNLTPAWLPAAPTNAANYIIATDGRQVYLKYTASVGADVLTLETAANGSGTLVSDQTVPAGSTVKAYAIERTAGGVFVTNQAANWSLINLTGGAVGGDLVAAGDGKSATFTGHLVGSGQLRAGALGLTSTKGGTLTVVAGPASQVRVETQADGTGTLLATQTLAPSSFFTLYAITRDVGGNFIANVSATWSLTSKQGNFADTDLSPAGTSATFVANNVGSGIIHATSGSLTPVDSGVLTVISGFVWNGTGANWDTTTAANWWMIPNYNNAPFANNFASVTFDDSGVFGNPAVNLVGSLSPLSVSFAANSGSYTFGGTGKITGAGSLTNSGTAAVTLQTANDFTGGTTLTTGAGTLTLSGNGAIQNSSPITMAAGTTVNAAARGDGTWTLNTNQVLQGNGTFSVTGNLTNQGTIKLKVTKTSTALTSDQLAVSGTLTYGGTLQLVVAANPALTTNDTFQVFSAAGYKGAFATVTPAPGANLAWNTNTLAVDGVLRIGAATTVATNPTNISYTISGNTLTLTWPADHLGWYAQSNSVSLASTNYWFDIPGSQLATNQIITISPAQANVFYRLRKP